MTLTLESQSFPASEIRGELRAFKRQKCYGYCLASLDETEIDRFLDVEGILNSARTAKDSLGTTAGIFSLNGADFFIKRYNAYSFKRKFRQLFGMPRPFRTMRATEEMLKLHIAVPQLIMALERKDSFFTRCQAIITVAYPEPLTVAEQISFAAADGVIGGFLTSVARLAAKIHRHNIVHGDMKMQNILMRQLSDMEFALGLFDFDGVQFGPVSMRKRCKEVARIITSFIKVCRQNDIQIEQERVESTVRSAYNEAAKIELDPAILKRYLRQIAAHKERYPL